MSKNKSSSNGNIGKAKESKVDMIAGSHKDDKRTDENKNRQEKVPVFSSNDAIDSINIHDSTIEVVGFIDSCERPKTVGTSKKYKIMKFVINNGAGRRVQCVAWEDNVAKVEDIVTINKIVHLDRVSAKRLDQKYNMGNIPFELSIRQSTEITDKGFYGADEFENAETKEVEDWRHIADMEGQKIKINGWIKSSFQQTHHKSGQATFGIGAVTDGKMKLEIRITAWSDEKKVFKKGQAVQVTGTVKAEEYTYLQAENASAIVPTLGVEMEPDSMINITVTPQKKARLE